MIRMGLEVPFFEGLLMRPFSCIISVIFCTSCRSSCDFADNSLGESFPSANSFRIRCSLCFTKVVGWFLEDKKGLTLLITIVKQCSSFDHTY